MYFLYILLIAVILYNKITKYCTVFKTVDNKFTVLPIVTAVAEIVNFFISSAENLLNETVDEKKCKLSQESDCFRLQVSAKPQKKFQKRKWKKN